MQLEIKFTFDSAEEIGGFFEKLSSVFPSTASAPGKPEKVKEVKPDKKEKQTIADTKPADVQPDKKEADPKPDQKSGEFDISTPESIEACRVQFRAKASALNEAGYIEHTRKALANLNAASITKMEPEKFKDYWQKLLLIEAGQFDKI